MQNIKDYCARRNVKPTVACRESGVGSSFINNIEARGQVPSVEKVQLLAQYLGVTTSDLLGEEFPATGRAGQSQNAAFPKLSQTAVSVAKAYDQAGAGIQESVCKLLDVDEVPQESGHTKEAKTPTKWTRTPF